MRTPSLVALGIAAVLTLSAVGAPAQAAPAKPAATVVSITVKAPAGVPANVLLRGGTKKKPVTAVAAKPVAGTKRTVTIAVPGGKYAVSVPSVVVNGARYSVKSKPRPVTVKAKKTTRLTLVLVREPGASALQPTNLTNTAIGLTWTGATGASYALRRASGEVAPASRTAGTAVAVKATSASDAKLAAGAKYAYSLFSKVKGRWYGPLTLRIATVSAAGSGAATYVAGSTTTLAKASDVTAVQTLGTGLAVQLSSKTATPLVGSALVLPVSAALPGGYLGVVQSVSADGRTVVLTSGSIDDAFDYFSVSVPSFTTDPSVLPLAKVKAQQAKMRATERATTKATTKRAAALGALGRTATTPSATAPATSPKLLQPRAGGLQKCLSYAGSTSVKFTPKVAVGGSFTTTVNKIKKLFITIPTGASFDMSVFATVAGAADVEAKGEIACGLDLPKLMKTLPTAPVPISVLFEPTIGFTASGALKASNVGVAVTGGVHVAGSLSIKDGASFSGNKILAASPLTPSVAANGSIGLTIGGALTVGPGVGTAGAGVIAGVYGELNLLKGSFTPYFPKGSKNFNLCTVTDVQLEATLGVQAKAWISKWSYSKQFTLDALQGAAHYPGFPMNLPAGCNSVNTPTTLLGDNVTAVNESNTGSPSQWDHVDGFVPGKQVWALSTGNVADSVGAPDFFASTGLGGPGDEALSALSGYPTYDAAAYTVTLVPAGSTLHVRFVFASEEYPEYVGSSFNDVMSLTVNGSNCAFVPGTSTPVTVNSVNGQTNSQYYVDNSAGAAGYGTSMDGLTVPLTCNVPVTPGQPVTVRIAIADSSDSGFDSAIALVDGGIWAD